MRAFPAEHSLAMWLRGKGYGMARRMMQNWRAWAAFWNSAKILALRRDRINDQDADWQQEYAAYFGIYPPKESRSG